MDYFDLSLKSKKRLIRWISKRYRDLSISELVRNSRDERQLFKMCRYIDKWYDQHEPSMKPLEVHDSTEEEIEASQEATGDADEDQELSAPATVMEVGYVVPEKHTRLKQHFSRTVTHRLNTFITQNPEVGISKMLSEAATEDDLMAAMDKIESEKAVVDPLIKIWTVRQVV